MAVDEWRVHARSLWAPTDDSRGSSPDSCHSGSAFDNKRAPRKRASRPKVRTGCICCKRRHVKCDERKPDCLRCETFGIECEGYAPPRPVREFKPVARVDRLLLPRLSRRAGLLPAATSPPALAASTTSGIDPALVSTLTVTPAPRVTPSQHDHNAPNFIDAYNLSPFLASPSAFSFDWEDGDNHYWSMFTRQVVNHLSPHFESDFWSRISLRESIVNDCIRHSILGIGAYCLAIISARDDRAPGRVHDTAHATAGNGADDALWMDARRNKHHQAALSHHTKALSYLRHMMKGPAPDTRLTIMATLLFIVFENMRGHYHTAGSLIRSGIRVLRSAAVAVDARCAMAPPEEPVLPPTLTTAPALLPPAPATHCADASLRVPPQATSSPAHASPAPALTDIDDEMAEMTRMFARHSVVCVYIPFPNSKRAYNMLLDHRQDPSFPSANPMTLDQARRAWDFYFPHLGTFLQQNTWQHFNTGFDFDALAAVAEQAEHLDWLRRFGGVLDTLRLQMGRAVQEFSSHGTSAPLSEGKRTSQWTESKAARGLTLLSVQHDAATIFASCCLDPTEMAYDAFTPRFTRLVAACASVINELRHPHHGSAASDSSTAVAQPSSKKLIDGYAASEPGFASEGSLLPVLGFVISKCRVRQVRARALQLVRDFRSREGSWDSRSLANGMVGLLALEEPELPDRSEGRGVDSTAATTTRPIAEQQRIPDVEIPARDRWVWTNVRWDVDRRRMLAQYTRALPDKRGLHEQREFSMAL